MLYTVKITKGEAFFQAGSDTFLRIHLNGTGPVLEIRVLMADPAENPEANDVSSNISVNPISKKADGYVPGPILGTQEILTEFGSIYMEFGQIQDR